MRHLAFRFVRHAPSLAGSHFVVDPYLDYRERLNSKWKQGLEQRRLNIDYDLIQNDFNRWWQAFVTYNKDPNKENKASLLDTADGLTNVLKLPNTVVDLQKAGTSQEQKFDFLQSTAKNVAEIDEWLSTELYNHLFLQLPSVVRQSPLYRIRPVFLDACNLSEMEYPRVDDGDNIFTSLVGVSLPTQLALIMMSCFSKKNAFPLNLLAVGASYKQSNSLVEQQSKASLLSICDQESTAISSFYSIADTLDSFFRRLQLNFTNGHAKPEELESFSSSSILFNSGGKQIATISFIGTYISERLNIRLNNTSQDLKFVYLCHADVNLSEIGNLLLNRNK